MAAALDASAPLDPAAGDRRRTLFHAAWMAIALGLVIELALLALAAGAGTALRAAPVVSDLVQKISWSVIVCVGLAFGKATSGAAAGATGLAGLVAAPSGFVVARALHRAAASALGLAASAAAGPSPLLVAAVKGAEYAVLGLAAARFARGGRGLGAHLAAGVSVGVIFGGVLVFVATRAAAAPLAASALAARGINEVVFPAGCAAVLYAADVLAKKPA